MWILLSLEKNNFEEDKSVPRKKAILVFYTFTQPQHYTIIIKYTIEQEIIKSN